MTRYNRYLSPSSCSLLLLLLHSILLLLLFITDHRVECRNRGYLPSSRHRSPRPRPHLFGSCVIGGENRDTGLVMADDDDDDDDGDSKYIGSVIAEDSRDCAHQCCEMKACSLAWFIDVRGKADDDDANCFLVNCDDPHICRLKRSNLKDSVTYVFRKSRSKTTTTTTTTTAPTTTTKPRLEPFLKAIANYNLGASEMEMLLSSLDSLSEKEQLKIESLIDTVLAKHGFKNATEAQTAVPTVGETTTTTTTTTTKKTKATKSSTTADSSAKEKTTASQKTAKIIESQSPTAEKAKIGKEKEKADSSSDKSEKGSKRPEWMQPRDSAVSAAATSGALAGASADVDAASGASASFDASEPQHHRQLQPPRVHMGLLTAACVIGVVATVVVVLTMQNRVRRAWRKKDYIDADYLINGMYQPNI